MTSTVTISVLNNRTFIRRDDDYGPGETFNTSEEMVQWLRENTKAIPDSRRNNDTFIGLFELDQRKHAMFILRFK